jgi:subtilisin family serine protease
MQSSDEPVFQKADGYACTENVIPEEYLVRMKDDSLKIVHAKDDEAFLENYFEPNKENLKSAEPHYRVSVSTQFFGGAQNTTKDNWGVQAIHADRYWAQNIYGSSVIVAVVDTGVDISHTQLQSQIAYNQGEIPGNGIDDDNNGYVDDWAGYDFYNDRGLTGDNAEHGTHVSGIIAAAHNARAAGPSTAVEGVAPQAKILPAAFMGPDGSGAIESAVKAIRYAVSRGAKIINASWGGSACSVTLRDEIRGLQEKNVLFVAAAGNNGVLLDTWPEYPAAFESLSQLTVGSIDANFMRSSFSNYSSRFVQIFAPGGGITSTVPGGYATFSGTSMATPFVSGAAALLWSQDPTLSAIDVRQRILQSIEIESSYQNQTRGRLAL